MSSLSSSSEPTGSSLISEGLSSTVTSDSPSATAPSITPTTFATMMTTSRRTTTTPYSRFLSLTSVYRTTSGCASNIYKDATGGFTAWDPNYGRTYASTATSCQPTVVTSWFTQDRVATPTALGSTYGSLWFSCPNAYSTVTPPSATATSNATVPFKVNDGLELVLCCPSGYTYNTTATVSDYRPGYFPSQCYSTLTASEVLRYMTIPALGAAVAETTTVPTDQMLTVYGIPVNGFRGTSTSASSRPTFTTSSTTSSSTSSRASQQLPLILGLTFGLLFVLAIIVGIARRAKTRRRSDGPALGNVRGASPAEIRPLQPSVSQPPRTPGMGLGVLRTPAVGVYRPRDSNEDEAPPPYKP